MKRVRRLSSDVHVELTPLIDVVFLLLTFFLFAIVMMVRADVLDVNLPQLAAGKSAQRTIPITIAITQTGELFVNSKPVEMDGIIEHLQEVQAQLDADSKSALVLAVDIESPAGVMITLADKLTGAGLGEFSIIGRKESQSVERPRVDQSSNEGGDKAGTESP